MEAALPSDHYPITATVKVKVAHIPKAVHQPKKDLSNAEGMQEFTWQVEAAIVGMEENQQTVTWDSLVQLMKAERDKAFPPKEYTRKKDYISESTWDLIKERKLLQLAAQRYRLPESTNEEFKKLKT